jgi:mono/diheme cytochrome c family protein
MLRRVLLWFAAIPFVTFGLVTFTVVVFAQDSAKTSDDPISGEAAKKLKSPVPYTKKSIVKGRGLFARSCTGCHGPDGKATVDVVANATDLTSPKLYQNGFSEGEIFRSIRDGQGASMPSFKSQVRSEEDIWNLVNFIRSLWPESMRPPLQEDKEADDNKSK